MLRAISGMCEGLKNGGNARVQFPIIEVMRQRLGLRSKVMVRCGRCSAACNGAVRHPPPGQIFLGSCSVKHPSSRLGVKIGNPAEKKFW